MVTRLQAGLKVWEISTIVKNTKNLRSWRHSFSLFMAEKEYNDALIGGTDLRDRAQLREYRKIRFRRLIARVWLRRSGLDSGPFARSG